jgi:cell wall assembly regulator SMI1
MSLALEPVDALERIHAWVSRNHPSRLPFLRLGAKDDTIQRIEGKLGRALPPCLRRLYAAYDGQPEGTVALFLNQRWLPLDLVVVAWEDLCFRHGSKMQPVQVNGDQCQATVVWSADWLPIFGSPRGDHYCIDLGAEHPGRNGQIIWFLYDEPDRPVVAQNIASLFSRIAVGVETGRWRADDAYDGLCD